MEGKIQNSMGHDAYGRYAAWYAFCGMFVVLSDFGLTQYYTKTVAFQKEKYNNYFSQFFILKAALAVLFPVVITILAIPFFGTEWIIYILAVALGWSFNQMLQFIRGNFQAFHHFKTDGLASVSDRILLLLLVPWILSGPQILDRFVLGTLISTGGAFVLFSILSSRLYGFPKLNLKKSFIKPVLVKSFPFALIGIVYSLNDKLDRFMLEQLDSAHAAGIFSASARWIDAIMMYIWIVMGVFYAKFAKNQKNEKELKTIVDAAQVISAAPMIFITAFVLFYGELPMKWIFTSSSESELLEMTINFKIVVFSVFVNGFFIVYSTLLTAIGFEKPVTWFVLAGVGLKLVLNSILIPFYGTYAASAASVASFTFLSIVYLWLTWKFKLIQIPVKTISLLLLCFLIVIFAFYFLNILGMSWYFVTIVSGLIFLITLLGFRLVDYKMLKRE